MTLEAPGYFKQHEADDDRRFKQLIDDSTEIKGDIKAIKENHLAHIQVATEKMATHIEWLKYILGLFLIGIFGLAWASLK